MFAAAYASWVTKLGRPEESNATNNPVKIIFEVLFNTNTIFYVI